MAGAGYKLFATGDVLTAAQVNTYLMQQTVMVFASSAARTTALSGVLAEGMVSYLQDTNTLEVYDGSAWVGATGDITGLTAGTGISISSATGPVPTVAIDTAVTADLTTGQTLTNKTLTSPVLTTPSISNINAKGDILVGTADNTLGVITAGANGETIVADSSTSTGLRYQTGANGNYVINGGCDIWQRGTTWTGTGYSGADRWYASLAGTVTASQETSDLPTGVGVQYGLKYVTAASSSYAQFYTAFETATVKPMRGQTFTVSYYLKTAGSYAGGVILFIDYSTSTDALTSQTTNIATLVTAGSSATSWTRIQQTFTVPSTAVGLRIGILPDTAQASGVTVRIAAVQLELGSVATTFKRAGGTIQGELAACQRYYVRQGTLTLNTSESLGIGFGNAATAAYIQVKMPVPLRTVPSAVEYGGNLYIENYSIAAKLVSSISFTNAGYTAQLINCVVASGLTAGNAYILNCGGTNAYVGFSAEL